MKTEHSALVHRLEGIKSQSKQHQMIAQVGKKEDNYTIEVYCVCVICQKSTIFFFRDTSPASWTSLSSFWRSSDFRDCATKGPIASRAVTSWRQIWGEGEKIIFMYFCLLDQKYFCVWVQKYFRAWAQKKICTRVLGAKNMSYLGPKWWSIIRKDSVCNSAKGGGR